jgi:hypothetical protein
MDWFVKPEITRLPLSDNHFITVKRQLNTGEQHKLFSRLSPTVTPGEKTQFDTEVAGTAKVLMYLLGWSLVDANGPVAYSIETMSIEERQKTLNNLHPDGFRQIRDAIEKHEAVVDAEDEAKKNGQGTASASPAISPSVSDFTGDTSGSTVSH